MRSRRKTGGAVNTNFNKVTVLGNLSLTGGSVLSNTLLNQFWVQGSTATIGTLSTDFPVQLGLAASANQTLTSDTAITGGLLIRNQSTTVSSITDLIGSHTPGATLSLGTIVFQNATTTSFIGATLTSDVTSSATPVIQGTAFSSQTVAIDTAGHTLDLGTAAESLSATGAKTIAWSLLSSSPNGTFKASSFDLSGTTAPAGSTVGPNLTLQATGAGGTTNTLSNSHGGTIDPASTFSYAGTGTLTSFATLVSTRTIGNLAVTSGALQLGGAITTTGTGGTTVASGGALDLGATTLTTASVTSSGILGGSGTFATTAGVTSSGTFSPGEAGTVGTLNLTGSGLTLSSGNNSIIDVASNSSYDTIQLNGLSVTYDGTLTVNFTTTPAVGTTYTLFANTIGTATNFSSILTNLPASETASFDPSDGTLSVTPEPSSVATLGLATLGLLARRRRRKAI